MGRKKGLNPKVKNLFIFIGQFLLFISVVGYIFYYFVDEQDPLRLFALAIIAIVSWRILLSMYRRLVLPAKHPLAYGKWGIITGSTSGIGKEFAEHFASIGMSVLLISRSETKLREQCKQLQEIYKVDCEYLVYDFSAPQDTIHKNNFYKSLDKSCQMMHEDGGVGVLVNNVGTANEIPKHLEEFTDEDICGMINCNIHSIIWMTRTVSKYMKQRKNGAIISISSGSGNNPSPYLAIYSATKAFMTQFTRSLHIENWGTGVDFLVVTPFYIGGTNLYKDPNGTIVAPLPKVLVNGTLCQLGKSCIWQGHGYWFHGLLNNFANYYWGTTARWRQIMIANRERYDKRQLAKQEAEKKEKDK
jgi:short-subunit dehydrogenase